MNNYYLNKAKYLLLLVSSFFAASCENYLDVAPEQEITAGEIFGTFDRYQGYVEDLYQAIPVKTRSRFNMGNWNYSNDVISLQTLGLNYAFERGDYWLWQGNNNYHFFLGSNNPNINNQGEEANNANNRRGFWRNGWRGIRIANIAIQNIDLLNGTEEERNLILGQAYFFRAFFHFNILKTWGGVPYVDKVFSPDDKLEWPRLSYLETAQRIAEDFEMAAQLLPKSWDETVAGQKTSGGNAGRLTKGAAYGYLGKNWLYAASPLMNGMETGDYSSYNTEFAKKAADAFSELLKLADEGYYGLHSWEDYRKNFWTMTNESLIGKEWVWGHPWGKHSRHSYGEHLFTQLGGQRTGYAAPTLELVNKFGMANGLPIDETDAGYDATNPWEDRDPRFYYVFLLDGERMIHYTTAFPDDTYAQLFVNGRHRADNAITGIGQKKFWGPGANRRDARWGDNYSFMCPYMRLAHVYLMYAEAVNEGYGGPNGRAPGAVMSAIEAVDFVRERSGVPGVDERFKASQEVFRNTVRNEIGVELALEGHQWFDYRRWYVAHLPENRTKTGIDYDEEHTYFTPAKIAEILFDPAKHYWLPFSRNEAALYPGFYQNPGWN